MEVTIERLTFARDRRPVLDIGALTFLSGTTTAVFGPNGSGKTTLLRLIAGLERPTAGAVRIGGALAAPHLTRRHVAFAFQDAVFVSGSVRANLDLALKLRGVPGADRGSRIAEVARECGVGAILDRSARKLSSGEAQRVNLARALALRAPVTLLDEPLAGIDRITRTQLLEDLPRLLATFAATTIFVTHDREEAFRLADHLVLLAGGSVIAAGPKAMVYRAPGHRHAAELLGYTVLPGNDGLAAVPPGAFRLDGGPLAFLLSVERVVDMGNHVHIVGSVSDTRVDVRLPAGTAPPAAGTTLRVFATTFVKVS